ncbi:uncharacterized protein B0I36DRAFT_330427 [Microdochium trichocladiopsis]|uniref:CENP-V/GFA domain-containing protein n=1 Tax=Microdochium trichocladiopsis TaxID=1682393 RepID=A0A9P9BMJ6_9PEZI|nr:uncharacterized protein B0I36DRAFT_330427 [Microdochium trichocladiopsis]KAH7026338.1 hypothetical protein B0I36DRAFT_330427 [Microdochium trichocladiopsis]
MASNAAREKEAATAAQDPSAAAAAATATTVMNGPFKGRCICGALTFTIDPAEGAPLAAYLCHCLDCQRFSGSAFAHNATFRVADLTVEVAAGPEGAAVQQDGDGNDDTGAGSGSEIGGKQKGVPLEDQLSTYGDDVEGRMQFCRTCGTRLLLFCPAGSSSMRDKVVVPVGVLEGGFEDGRLAPAMEGWLKRKACWLRGVDLGLRRMGSE